MSNAAYLSSEPEQRLRYPSIARQQSLSYPLYPSQSLPSSPILHPDRPVEADEGRRGRMGVGFGPLVIFGEFLEAVSP